MPAWFLVHEYVHAGSDNNYMAYIIPGIVAPYNIILVKTLHWIHSAELEESAEIDGASYMTIFRKTYTALQADSCDNSDFRAVGNWNSFQDSLILMQSSPNLFTLQHRLYIYLNPGEQPFVLMSSSSNVNTSVIQSMLNGKVIKYTISMVTVLLILIVYPFMQRYFESGIMLNGAVMSWEGIVNCSGFRAKSAQAPARCMISAVGVHWRKTFYKPWKDIKQKRDKAKKKRQDTDKLKHGMNRATNGLKKHIKEKVKN